MKVVLASKSPRRLELLHLLGLETVQTVSSVDESNVTADSPAELVKKLSVLKAGAVASGTDGSLPVIAADTVVALGKTVLGKPKNRDGAISMLTSLSGKTHEVHTGVTVIHGGRSLTDVITTRVTFRELSEREIEYYVDSGDPMDKAGAYGIQCFAGCFVEKLEGDYFSVMGLPICRLTEMLTELGCPVISQ